MTSWRVRLVHGAASVAGNVIGSHFFGDAVVVKVGLSMKLAPFSVLFATFPICWKTGRDEGADTTVNVIRDLPPR
ncbi:hypothetical protein M378DRAFT_169929 [Amanita muscaria Koide BX008]|uniref:Uncharacterized protein n=1 Tax=Amanita muscaria (strain Koide BX008) TaxID=946122 RepID=A0A0C2WCC3_AMAMK|nr:hypothetical protein M378DRAFT_169929 [Amanita muscaria Koide BX008]